VGASAAGARIRSFAELILGCSLLVVPGGKGYGTWSQEDPAPSPVPGAVRQEIVALPHATVAATDTTVVKGRKDLADMDLRELAAVRLSPFDVSTEGDRGYLPSNSVSGSRIDVPIRDLPFAIQAFTGLFIRDQRATTLWDVARFAPGVTYRSNDFNEGNANLSIRGFAVGSLAGGNIHVLRDGFHGPSIFDFTNVARVEVVKGPASFLYGQVSPGGIVNVITKTPELHPFVSAGLHVGSYGEYRLETDATGPITESLFYRVSASYDQDMRYWKPYDGHSWDLSPSLLWYPMERVRVSVRYERYRKNEIPPVMQKPGYNTQSGVLPTAADPNRSGVDVPGLPDDWNSMSRADYRRSMTDGLNVWMDVGLSHNWNLRAGYSHIEFSTDLLFSGNLGMANNRTLLQGRRVRTQTYGNRGDSWELQALGIYRIGDVSVRLLLGAQFIDRVFDTWAAQAPNDPRFGSDPTATPLPLWDLSDPSTWDRDATVALATLTANRTDRSMSWIDRAVWAGSTFGFFNDRFLLLAGWRVTSTRSGLTDRVGFQSLSQVSTEMATPQFGVLCHVSGALSLFASYAESFVPSTQAILNIDSTTSLAEPTRGRGVDLGLKMELFGGLATGTITLFDIRNRNIINDLASTEPDGSVVIYNIQSGEQRSRGVEIDMTFTVDEHWQTYLSYSYMDARITAFSGNDGSILDLDPTVLDRAGQANYKNVRRFHNAPLQMSAPHLGNIWTRYTVLEGAMSGLTVAGGVNLVVDQTLLPDSPMSAHQSYGLITVIIGYTWAWDAVRLHADVMGKNIADARYRPSQSTRSRPREILFSLDAFF
jgi:iron complex outermembrane recepter protein